MSAVRGIARTIGAKVRQLALAPGRSNDVEPLWGLEAIPEFPYDGSGLVVWDFGTPAPPVENVPPSEGSDPHGLARTMPPDTLRAALDRIVAIGNPLMPVKKRSSGLRLRATDMAGEHGEGDEVSGPGEALLMSPA